MPPARASSMQLMPFHWTILAASVKKAKTISGLASTRTSRSTASPPLVTKVLPPLFGLRGTGEAFEAPGPKLVKKIAQLGEPFRPGLIQAPRPGAPLGDETGGLQHLEVLRYRRTANLKVSRDLA